MYGLQTYSDFGVTSVDGSYKAFRVLMSGYISDKGLSSPGIARKNYYPEVQSVLPLIFIRPATLGTFVYGGASFDGFTAYTYDNPGIYYVALVPVSAPSANAHGLIIYGESGITLFDSNYSLMSVDSSRKVELGSYVEVNTVLQVIGEQPFGTKKRYALHNPIGWFHNSGTDTSGWGTDTYGDGSTVYNETTTGFRITSFDYLGDQNESGFGTVPRTCYLLGGFF